MLVALMIEECDFWLLSNKNITIAYSYDVMSYIQV